jgi:ribosomal protein L11 methyltransferase
MAGWDTAWTTALEPVRVSRTLVLAPSTALHVGVLPEHVVRLEPARAFGFGEHPTTRLAAAAVERACRSGARTVLDVGTGTGVLALVASLRGARSVVGIDLDREAISVARRNLRMNAPPGQVRFTTLPLPRLRSRFALVVANLDYRTLRALSHDLTRAVAPKGRLVLTGMLGGHARDVERWFRELGFVSASRRRTAGGFALVTLAREVRGSSGRSPGAQRALPRGTSRKTRSR